MPPYRIIPSNEEPEIVIVEMSSNWCFTYKTDFLVTETKPLLFGACEF